jgi:hypothetical protein
VMVMVVVVVCVCVGGGGFSRQCAHLAMPFALAAARRHGDAEENMRVCMSTPR